jgi:hypothetical protein
LTRSCSLTREKDVRFAPLIRRGQGRTVSGVGLQHGQGDGVGPRPTGGVRRAALRGGRAKHGMRGLPEIHRGLLELLEGAPPDAHRHWAIERKTLLDRRGEIGGDGRELGLRKDKTSEGRTEEQSREEPHRQQRRVDGRGDQVGRPIPDGF